MNGRIRQNRNGKQKNDEANPHGNIFRGGNNLSKFHFLEFVFFLIRNPQNILN
jgi:hypothetical protein